MGIREKAESKKNILQNIITMPLLQFILAGVVAYLVYKFRHSTGHKESVRPLDKSTVRVY